MRKFIAVAVLGMLVSSPAVADTFVWQDAKHDYTMSFPDVWRIQTEDTPATRLRIAGPIAEDRAACRMQVEEDGRALIYPKRLTDEAVVALLDQNFWEGYIAQYENARITDYFAPASMGGKGDATAVKFSYTDNKTPMYGVMIGSVYGGKLYVASCGSTFEAYNKMAPVFAGILGSVDLKSKYHPFAIGYYRDFLADPKLVLPRVKPGTINPKNTFWFNENKYNQ